MVTLLQTNPISSKACQIARHALGEATLHGDGSNAPSWRLKPYCR